MMLRVHCPQLPLPTGTSRWGDPQDPKFGDLHFYNYRDDCLDPAIYPPGRFVSEFGFQSYPSWAAVQGATAPQDWSPTSEMFGYRQRHAGGNQQLQEQLARHFRLPAGGWDPAGNAATGRSGGVSNGGSAASSSSSKSDDGWQISDGGGRQADGGGISNSSAAAAAGGFRLFRSWLYLTQLQQAMCYETAIMRWRRLRSDPDALTMGILYW